MRMFITALILAFLAAPNAHAVVDPDPDGIGVYFDLDADVYEITVGPGTPFHAYAILTNPTGSGVRGYEFSCIFSTPPGMEGWLFKLQEIWHGFNEILPVEPPLMGPNFMIGFGTPIPAAPTVKLVTWQFMLLTPMVVDFYMGPSTGEFGTRGLLVYESPAGPVPMHVSSGDPDLKVATVNGTGVVSVTPTSYGSLKALYR